MNEYLCIVCPLGCRLQVRPGENGQEPTVEGASCRRGREYALQEATAPQRVLTTTLATAWGRPLPVRTVAPVAKAQLLDIARRLSGLVVERRVAAGEVIVPDVDGAGTPLIATADGGICREGVTDGWAAPLEANA